MTELQSSTSPNRRFRRRVRQHLALAVGAGLVVLLGLAGLPGDGRTRLSLSLAYAAFFALIATLSLGPLRRFQGRLNPTSFDLRRDLGLWSAILALAHTAVGLTVHFRGRMTLYFLAPESQQLPGPIRLDAFGLANHSGLAAALLLAGLALISSDKWLGRLGPTRWKRWQRFALVAAGLTVVHGLAYQLLEARAIPLILLLLALGGLGVGLRYLPEVRPRRAGA